LILSAVSLAIGGAFLYAYDLVPIVLVETTFVAVVVLIALSYFVARGSMISINISTLLGITAPIISYLTPAHVGVLEQIGGGGLIGFLGVLQLLGFYIFPIVYVIVRLVFRGRIRELAHPKKLVKADN